MRGPAQCGINSRMAKRVTSHAFDRPSLSNGLLDGPLEDGFVDVMAAASPVRVFFQRWTQGNHRGDLTLPRAESAVKAGCAWSVRLAVGHSPIRADKHQAWRRAFTSDRIGLVSSRQAAASSAHLLGL